jgi:hypothetical protein
MPAVSSKSIADKLFLKPGKKVLFVNAPSGYAKTIGKMPAGVMQVESTETGIDVIQVFAENGTALKKQLPKLKKQLNADGALWVSYYKGTSKHKTDINRDIIAEYASTIGMEGVAIMSIDDDWSSLRLKIVG